MSAINFNTRNDTYRKLVGNGLTYRIPHFQRDYSWTEDEWEDLWLDILEIVQHGREPAHYMGYLVLQSDDEKTFDVIDGQQRLTTLSLIVLAVLKNLQRLVNTGIDTDRNSLRLEQIRQTYIGYLDPVTLIPRSKLTLNRNNDHYYQTYLVPLVNLPVRGFKVSEHSLRKAFEWFDRRIDERIRSLGGDAGVELARFVEAMSDRLFFTVITVTDELNAYKVFETLNARGVRLSATDLLKNYLFSVLERAGGNEYEIRALEDRWDAIVTRLGSEDFPDFLRLHWNSRNPFVRQTELFKVIRDRIRSREQVFELLRGIEEDLDVYLALWTPETSQWPSAAKKSASELRLFGVRQPTPLLLAVRRTFGDVDFDAVLRACVVISFRYNVIANQPAHEQERVYNAVAADVSSGKVRLVNQVVESLRSIYPSDDAFRAAFRDKILRTTQSRNRRVVRYMLCALEKQESGIDHDFESAVFDIEHVLPEHPRDGWEAFTDAEHEALVYRLGNMTLLNRGSNRDVGNAPYTLKRDVYLKSEFRVTNCLAEHSHEWTPQRIDARQIGMAKTATAIWRIAQLS
jgi:hypothetical protein